MIIDFNGVNPTNTGSTSRSGRSGSASPEAPDKASGETNAANASGDTVALSQEAQAMNRLEGAIGEAPEMDSDRIAEIQKAIAEGQFEVNAERIAEKMMGLDDLF